MLAAEVIELMAPPIYLDNHATTPVDPRVVDAMLPYFTAKFGNAGSVAHEFGWQARDAVAAARETVAAAIHAEPKEIVFTSGATESNNLALRGLAEHPRRRGNHVVSVATEHKALLDPLQQLARSGLEVTWLPVERSPSSRAGMVSVSQLLDSLRDDTLLVSVMLANNEMGVIQPLQEIGEICRERGILLHSDATQAVGKIPVDVRALQVDLLSFSAHKFYGPKGIGALFVNRRGGRIRLASQITGGGQESGRRSGTLNVPGIVGMARALQLAVDDLATEMPRLTELRDRLFRGLAAGIDNLQLNGPALEDPQLRLGNNLNCCFPGIDGEALMLSVPRVAMSSGSACTSVDPAPSHVLTALGLDPDHVRASVRFGLGRFNTTSEVDAAVELLIDGVRRLRAMGSGGMPT
jgi:cysteine desulfurase